MIRYGFTKELDLPFEEVKASAVEALKKEGFGILTEIDVQAKFKEKLGIAFRKYVILGACSPAHAHRAILAEANVGLLLPCNVIVYEEGDRTVLSAIKPAMAMQMIGNPELGAVAEAVETQLKNAFDAVGAGRNDG